MRLNKAEKSFRTRGILPKSHSKKDLTTWVEQMERAPMPDWLRHALKGSERFRIIPLNKAAGAKRNLSIGEINSLITTKGKNNE